MPGNSNLHDSSRNKQDEFYTNLQLIEDELKHYRAHFNRPVSRNSDAFAYNTRGEVASATVDACSAAYAYDGIGNLLETSVATGGLTADATYYDANALNQYYSIWSPDDSSWIEHSTNGELTRLDDRGFLYDAKSRLISVGEWVFDEDRYQSGDYDSHDELYSFEPIVSNRYDYLNRRVQKITSAATHTYFYDGWMLIKEVVANTNGTTEVIEYHWGKDLSGTIGGAGGVGGLLYLTISNSNSQLQLYVPWYDAYGNIMGYWDAQGNVVAEYVYDAFGKLIASSGPMANVFSFRYSTKYFDSETGLYYYGYRYYSPELMRWITRDPIEEEGGVNLYAFCENGSLSGFDPDGCVPLDTIWDLGNIVYDICVDDDVALATDIAALFVPYLPAGSTKLVKVSKLSYVEKICPAAKQIQVTYKYVTHGNKHFKLASHGRLPINKRAEWVIEIASGPAQFLPGFSHKEGEKLVNQVLQVAKDRGLMNPNQLNGFIYDTGKVIGASAGKLTTKVQIYVTPQGEVHVRPK